MRTGLQLYLEFLSPLLNTGVIFVFFQEGLEIRFFDKIIKTCKKDVSKHICIFSDNFCRNTSQYLGMLQKFPFLKFVSEFLFYLSLKRKMAVLNVCCTLLLQRVCWDGSCILQYKVFKTLVVLQSPTIISSLPINIIFLLMLLYPIKTA